MRKLGLPIGAAIAIGMIAMVSAQTKHHQTSTHYTNGIGWYGEASLSLNTVSGHYEFSGWATTESIAYDVDQLQVTTRGIQQCFGVTFDTDWYNSDFANDTDFVYESGSGGYATLGQCSQWQQTIIAAGNYRVDDSGYYDTAHDEGAYFQVV